MRFEKNPQQSDLLFAQRIVACRVGRQVNAQGTEPEGLQGGKRVLGSVGVHAASCASPEQRPGRRAATRTYHG